MHDYFPRFVITAVFWVCLGLFYEFGFRRSDNPRMRSVASAAGLFWLVVGIWMIYNFVMWRRSP